jgi:nucleoside-diphosphate-sugar epimerase
VKTVLVTGAGGFVGRALVPFLKGKGCTVRALERGPGLENRDWAKDLEGVEAVVHLAGRAHRMDEDPSSSADAYARDNVLATRALAEGCAKAGVKPVVFASTVKVIGEFTTPGAPFTEATRCLAQDAYGVSKAAAEDELLRRLPSATVLRLPLVYGPGMKGNMAALWKAVGRGLPLPLAGIDNLRSLLYVGNLCDAVYTALLCEAARGKTFLLRDGEDLSTTDLARRIGRAQGRTARLVKAPQMALRWAARLSGKGAAAERLLGSLQVDDALFRATTGWKPPYTVDQGLAACAQERR